MILRGDTLWREQQLREEYRRQSLERYGLQAPRTCDAPLPTPVHFSQEDCDDERSFNDFDSNNNDDDSDVNRYRRQILDTDNNDNDDMNEDDSHDTPIEPKNLMSLFSD